MIISGKAIAEEIQSELKAKIAHYGAPRKPHLAVVLVGDNRASHSYVRAKKRACLEVGIFSTVHEMPQTIAERELLSKIETLNNDASVDGILIQSPLPSHLHYEKVIETLDPEKDVDGFHPKNMGKLLLGVKGGFIPCTPLGIQVLLARSKIDILGQHVVVVGRSNIVGKPLAALLMQNAIHANATVTIVHSKSRDLSMLTSQADILVAAVGVARFIKEEMVKEGAIVIDVGINYEQDSREKTGYRIVGDVDFEAVQKKCKAITPVPKGIGPMTIAMLLENTFLSFKRRLQ